LKRADIDWNIAGVEKLEQNPWQAQNQPEYESRAKVVGSNGL
jgi:hypothetical protein